MNADALAIGQVRVLPGAGLPEFRIISQQPSTCADVNRVAIERNTPQTSPTFLAKPFNIGEIVFQGVEYGLVGQINHISAAVGLTLGGAMNNRRDQQF